jgi:WD40 repeat protein
VTDNPYVGPKAFARGDRGRFFGRAAETRELTSLVIARRAVLLHAQSGAGKTSLLQAGLIPELERRERMEVYPIARVMGGNDGPADAGGGNVYIASALAYLFPRGTRATTLAEAFEAALEGGGEADDRPHLAIFDQFEEIFTYRPELIDQRRAFIGQLGAALAEHPRLNVLLSMREDYLADLDACADVLPDRMRTRMRLERLKRANALEAIAGPAAAAGMSFTPGAADALVDNLLRVRTGAAGDQPFAIGPYAEPVQLQIVCRQLWANLADERAGGQTWIDAADVARRANVDNALRDFYHQALATAVGKAGVSERALRDWFGAGKLITSAGTRGMVFRGAAETRTEGLANAAADSLVNSYILRAEPRAGGTWFELAHDRLVEPILTDNLDWERANPNPLADALRRDPNALLSGGALDEAARFARDNDDALKPRERDLLRRSEEARQRREADIRRRRALLIWVSAATVAVIVALSGLTVWALWETSLATTKTTEAETQKRAAIASAAEADRQRRAATEYALRAVANADEAQRQATIAQDNAAEADAQKLLSASRNPLSSDNDLSLLLAVEGARIRPSPEYRARLQESVSTRGQTVTTLADGGRVTSAAWSPDGSLIVSTSYDHVTPRLWDGLTGRFMGPCGEATGQGFVSWDPAPGLRRLVIGGIWGATTVWKVVAGRCEPDDSARMSGLLTDRGYVHAAWSRDGARLLITSQTGVVSVADLVSGRSRIVNSGVFDLDAAWSGDELRLVTAGEDGVARIRDAGDFRVIHELKGHRAAITAVAWSADGQRIATASSDGTARIWDAAGSMLSVLVVGRGVHLRSIAWNPSGSELITTSDDGAATVWTANGRFEASLNGHTGPVNDAVWRADSRRVLTASDDGSMRIWDPARQDFVFGGDEPDSESPGPVNWEGPVRAAWNGDESRVVTAGAGRHNGRMRVWEADSGRLLVDVPAHPPTGPANGGVISVAWSPDSRRLLTAGADGKARVWDAATGRRLFEMAGSKAPLTLAAWSPDGARIFTASDNPSPELRLWTREGQPSPLPPLKPGGAIFWAAWDARGERIVTASNGWPFAQVWNASNGAERDLCCHGGQVWRAEWSSDGRRLLTASNDGTAAIWDAASGRRENTFQPSGWFAAFNHQGTKVVTASEQGSALIWSADPKVGHPLATLMGHGAEVRYAAWSPDDRFVVTGSKDNTARVWDASSGALAAVLAGHSGPVRYAAWNRAGTRILTASDDGTARVWLLELPDLIAAACRRVSRNMTTKEWETYMGQSPYRQTCPAKPVAARPPGTP